MASSSRLSELDLPMIGELFPDSVLAERRSTLAALDAEEHTGARRRLEISYGFWSDVIDTVDGAPWSPPALARLRLCEEGLRVARNCGRLAKYAAWLGNADGQYIPALAELGVIGRLGAVATAVALDVPGRRPPKNYDLHATLPRAGGVHVEVKYRAERPLGVAPSGAAQEIIDLAFPKKGGSDFLLGFAKNRVLEEEIYEIASLVEEIGKMLDHPGGVKCYSLDARDLHSRQFPRVLARRLHVDTGELQLVHALDRYHVCFDIATRRAWTDHPVLEWFERIPGQGRVWALPVPETQAVLSREARNSFGSGQRFDDDTPESHRYRDRLVGAEDQLPDASTSLVAFGLRHERHVVELRLACEGEPMRQADGSVRSCGGTFVEPGWDHVAGVLAFWLDVTGDRAAIRSSWLPNPGVRADRSASDDTIEEIRAALLGAVAESPASPV